MNLQYVFTHVEPTDAIKEKIDKKSQKLKKYFQRDFDVKWTCSVTKDGHTSLVNLSGDGLTINATSTQDQLYKTFDDVISKLEKQLSKERGQRRNFSNDDLIFNEEEEDF